MSCLCWLLKFQRVGYLTVAVPSVENFLMWIVGDHAVVSKLVFELDVGVPSLTSGCVIGIVDGCCLSIVAIDHVNNTTSDKRIAHAFHNLRRNTSVSMQYVHCQGVK